MPALLALCCALLLLACTRPAPAPVELDVRVELPDLRYITAAIAPLSTEARIPLHTSQLTLHTSPFKEV
jgi:hypothetical protein